MPEPPDASPGVTATERLAPRQRMVLTARQVVDVAPPRLSLALVSAFEGRTGERELAFLPALARAGSLALDVGANRGVYARRLGRLCPRVVACEPQPRLAARLAAATPDNVVVLPVALSDTAGETTLRVPTVGRFVAHTRGTLEGVDGTSHAEVTVLRLRLDDLGLDDVGFVKLDVEGHELEVLEGGIETFRRSRPRLLVECDTALGARPADVSRCLAEDAYVGWFHFDGELLPVPEFDARTHQPERKAVGGQRPRARATNFMFLPEEEAPAVLDAIRAIMGAG